jgi:uncharacterized protein YcnI
MNSLRITVARHLRRALAPPLLALTLALLALVTGAGSVAAHVGILPAEAPPGTSQTFTVRVPTERDVPTIRVRMEFPNGMTVSRFQPKPGWQREIERDASGRITAVVWSGGKIEPAEYEDFYFIARTPQETGKLAFKAYQSYEGGETVEWVNDAEPRPAPAMTIRAAAPSTTTNPSIENPGQAPAAAGAAAGAAGAAATARATTPAGATAPAAAPVAGSFTAPAAAQNGGSDLPLFAALVAVALALLATAMAAVALSRGRQTPPAPSATQAT